jgi:alkaline phosphatase D
VPPSQEAILAENSLVRFHSQQRGYVRVGVTPEAVRADFKVVDFVDRPGGSVSTAATFLVENGRPGLVRG